MSSEAKKKELLDQLQAFQKEVSSLKDEITKANSKKEESLKKKQECGKQIVELISKVKDSKKERNEKTDSVKELKEKRKKLNDVIHQKILPLKELKKKREELFEKKKIKESPEAIRKKIDTLEYQIETEGMSFEKEQKTMKVIASLKKGLVEASKDKDAFNDVKKLSKEVKAIKKEADDVHNQIQQNATKSQEHHEEMIGVSKKIDELRKTEKEFASRFIIEKKEYQEANSKLKAKLDEMTSIKRELDKYNIKIKERNQEKKAKSLKEKTREVEEKIKKREKLTTDDLIVMQGMKD